MCSGRCPLRSGPRLRPRRRRPWPADPHVRVGNAQHWAHAPTARPPAPPRKLHWRAHCAASRARAVAKKAPPPANRTEGAGWPWILKHTHTHTRRLAKRPHPEPLWCRSLPRTARTVTPPPRRIRTEWSEGKLSIGMRCHLNASPRLFKQTPPAPLQVLAALRKPAPSPLLPNDQRPRNLEDTTAESFLLALWRRRGDGVEVPPPREHESMTMVVASAASSIERGYPVKQSAEIVPLRGGRNATGARTGLSSPAIAVAAMGVRSRNVEACQ